MKEYGQMAVRLMKDLVKFDTSNAPGNERPLAEYIADILRQEGFEIEVQVVAENRANMIASFGQSDRNLILNGHLDVVPPGSGWNCAPFCVTEKEGRFYGRGTCDMKGGLAAMMAAAIKVKRENTLKNKNLVLAFVADEEINGTGTKYFARHFEKGKQNIVVIGEPTQNQIHVAHRGVVRLVVGIYGKQCHSGRPYEGMNALTLLGRFLVEVEGWNQRKQKLIQPILPPPTVAATIAAGGIKDNVIPGYGEVVLDFRTVPGDTAKQLELETEAVLKRLFETEDVSWIIETYIDVAPGMTDPEADSVKIAQMAYERMGRPKPGIAYFSAGCDLSCFLSEGFDGILCGPGSLAQAHVVDEYIEGRQLEEAVDFYESYILSM